MKPRVTSNMLFSYKEHYRARNLIVLYYLLYPYLYLSHKYINYKITKQLQKFIRTCADLNKAGDDHE